MNTVWLWMSLKLRKITSETVTTAVLPWRNTTNFMNQLKHKKAKEHPTVPPCVRHAKSNNKSPADVSKHGGRRSSCDLLTRSPVPSIKHCVCAWLIVCVSCVLRSQSISVTAPTASTQSVSPWQLDGPVGVSGVMGVQVSLVLVRRTSWLFFPSLKIPRSTTLSLPHKHINILHNQRSETNMDDALCYWHIVMM